MGDLGKAVSPLQAVSSPSFLCSVYLGWVSSQVSLAPAAQLAVDEAFPVSRECCFRRIYLLLAACIPLVLVTWLHPHQDLMREAFVSRFTDGKAEAQRGRV